MTVRLVSVDDTVGECVRISGQQHSVMVWFVKTHAPSRTHHSLGWKPGRVMHQPLAISTKPTRLKVS